MTVTLITGANKGLGYETARLLTARGHTVYIGARSIERGQAAAAALGARFVRLDVTDDASTGSPARPRSRSSTPTPSASSASPRPRCRCCASRGTRSW
jgi:NAD(P)-dependent dehydrogenase (short-subunit alcohol dehydrogenase family)